MTTAGEFATMKDDLLTHLSGYCSGSNAKINGVNPGTAATAFATSLQPIDDISGIPSWKALQVDLSDLSILVGRLATFLSRFDGTMTLWFFLSMLVTSSLAGFCIFMLVCAWKSGKEGYKFVGEEDTACYMSFLNFVATPLFGLLLAAAWFGVSTIFTVQTANADFCYGEIVTGETVTNIMIERGYAKTTDAYRMVDEYLHVSLL